MVIVQQECELKEVIGSKLLGRYVHHSTRRRGTTGEGGIPEGFLLITHKRYQPAAQRGILESNNLGFLSSACGVR